MFKQIFEAVCRFFVFLFTWEIPIGSMREQKFQDRFQETTDEDTDVEKGENDAHQSVSTPGLQKPARAFVPRTKEGRLKFTPRRRIFVAPSTGSDSDSGTAPAHDFFPPPSEASSPPTPFLPTSFPPTPYPHQPKSAVSLSDTDSARMFATFKFKNVNNEFCCARMPVRQQPDMFEELMLDIRKRFFDDMKPSGSLKLYYVDEDGDKVRITNDEDLMTCINEHMREGTVKTIKCVCEVRPSKTFSASKGDSTRMMIPA